MSKHNAKWAHAPYTMGTLIVLLLALMTGGCGGGTSGEVYAGEAELPPYDDVAADTVEDEIGEECQEHPVDEPPAVPEAPDAPGSEQEFTGDPYELVPELAALADEVTTQGTKGRPTLCLPWNPGRTIRCTQGYKRGHRGVDFALRTGNRVRACSSGRVVVAAKSGWNWGYGKYVVIYHRNGWSTLYAHLRNVYVRKGKRVRRHQLIGRSGNTGNSTGPHIHLEVRKRNKAWNPAPMSRYRHFRPGRKYKHRTCK